MTPEALEERTRCVRIARLGMSIFAGMLGDGVCDEAINTGAMSASEIIYRAILNGAADPMEAYEQAVAVVRGVTA